MTDRIPPYNDQPIWPPPAIGHPAPSQPSRVWLDEVHEFHHDQDRREDRDSAIGHAIAALGDSALTHDGWLRPRVWELADQIAAYIADGSRP